MGQFRFRRFVSTALLLLAVVFGLNCTRPQRALAPEPVSFWYWHSPYQLSVDDQEELEKMGVRRLFVRAGTFSSDGANLVLVAPQSYKQGSDAFPVHLVFNCDGGVIRHFGTYDVPKISGQIASRIMSQVMLAEKAGLHVEGIQTDFDCPTRLLPRYADLVRRLRSSDRRLSRAGNLAFSATGLFSWLGTSGVKQLSKELDFLVPQAYEGVTGRTLETFRTLFDPDELSRKLELAEQLDCPYYLGVPTYGHALLYDDQGRLASVYRGLEPDQALAHPSFRLIDAFASSPNGMRPAEGSNGTGEETMLFRAVKPAPDGRGLGYTLTYTVPTSDMVSQWKSIIENKTGPNYRGVIMYRFPQAKSLMALSLPAVNDALNGVHPRPELKVKLSTNRETFEMIENEQPPNQVPLDVHVEVENTGHAAPFVGPSSTTLQLTFDRPGIVDASCRDMDGLQLGLLDRDGRFRATSPGRADTVRFVTSSLVPGTKRFAGPVRLVSPDVRAAKIVWTVRDANGKDVIVSPVQEIRFAQERKERP